MKRSGDIVPFGYCLLSEFLDVDDITIYSLTFRRRSKPVRHYLTTFAGFGRRRRLVLLILIGPGWVERGGEGRFAAG